MVITIDLTKEEVTCVEHPIIKIVRVLNEAAENEVIVIVSKDDVPSVKILEMIADKLGYTVAEVHEGKNIIKAKLIKQAR